MNNLISIIIPANNVEECIRKCVDSIKNQSYQNFEVFLVENGSTDRTSEICSRICEEDSRFVLLHSDIGVSRARNTGLESANGEWFAFVDADDWIEPNYLDVLLANAIEFGAKLSVCSFIKEHKYQIRLEKQNDTIILDGPAQCIHNYICSDFSMEGMIWNKLYDRKAFGDIRFDEILTDNEDCMFMYEVASRCDRACVSNAKLYHWFQRENSLSHTRVLEKELSAANVFLKLLKLTEPYNDVGVNYTLNSNFFNRMINTLFRVNKISGNAELVGARKICRQIYGSVRKDIPIKNLIKYWIVLLK